MSKSVKTAEGIVWDVAPGDLVILNASEHVKSLEVLLTSPEVLGVDEEHTNCDWGDNIYPREVMVVLSVTTFKVHFALVLSPRGALGWLWVDELMSFA